jgi:outer membrane receptor protein involved in Fe transport
LVSEYHAFGRLAAPVGRRVEAWGSVRVQGPHVPVGETSVQTRPYHVADLGATVRLQPGLELDLEVANLTNTRFVESRSSGFVAPGTPRSVRAQVRWSSMRP